MTLELIQPETLIFQKQISSGMNKFVETKENIYTLHANTHTLTQQFTIYLFIVNPK